MPEPSDPLLGLPFLKVQGTGNDFILIDSRGQPELSWPEVAEALCRRGPAVGADGLLVVLGSDRAAARMRMFNPDGTEDMCGNGLRCVVRYLDSRGEIPPEGATIEALSGPRRVAVARRDEPRQYEVEMGAPELAPEAMPALLDGDQVVAQLLRVDDRSFPITLVSMGTPHAVLINTEPLSDEEWRHYSCRIEGHPAFPGRITATWAWAESRARIRARFFERAVGPTLACGTGACSALVACVLNGLTDPHAEVVMPGGTVAVEWTEGGTVLLTGPAEIVYSAQWRGLGAEFC